MASSHGANPSTVVLEGVHLADDILDRANLERRLSGSSGADLIGANLKDADLEGAILDGAKLSGANLRGRPIAASAKLRGTHSQTPWPRRQASSIGADLDGFPADT